MRTNREFKQTEIGRIPKDWEVVRLGEMLIECYRYPTYYNIEYVTEGVPEIRGELLLENGQIQFDLKKFRYISENTAQKFHRVRVEEGDLVLSVRGTMGKIGYVPRELEGAVVTANLMRLSPDRQKTYPKWLMHYLSSDKFQRSLNNLSPHTTIKTIQAPLLKSISISRPPLPEQKKIAEIFSTVDQAIEKVDEAIEKTQRLKNGLMQKLLTKGIGYKEFKDTEIGRISKDWEIVRLESIIQEIKNGFASGKRDENGIVQIRMNNVTTDGQLVFNSFIKVPIPENIGEFLLKEDDFLFNNTNSVDLVGKSTIFKKVPFPCTFSNHFNRIRFNNKVIPEWILFHFIKLWEKGFFKSVAIRHVGQSAVHTKYLLNIKLPLPSLFEQKKIAEILSTVDKRLELLRERREKLERVKKGLMNDLLTGKKRIRLEA